MSSDGARHQDGLTVGRNVTLRKRNKLRCQSRPSRQLVCIHPCRRMLEGWHISDRLLTLATWEGPGASHAISEQSLLHALQHLQSLWRNACRHDFHFPRIYYEISWVLLEPSHNRLHVGGSFLKVDSRAAI
jgi:hypothetical protein